MEKIEKHHKKILFVILLIAVLIRILFIAQAPSGIHEDEAGMAYDAWSISEYGVDRYLNHYPVYLVNFGGGQSALYAYLAALFIKLFGFSVVTVRLPSVLLSIVTILVSYFTVKKLKSTKEGLLFAFLIAICPWHIMQSRWGLDCNLMASMLMISVYVLLKSKNKFMYALSGLLFGITLYSYALSYMIVPILLLFLFAYLLALKKIKITDIICFGIPLGILAIPLILNLMVNKGWLQPISNSIFSTPKLWAYRGAEISLGNISKNIWPILKSMFGYDINDYNAFPQFGTLYYISIPFFVLGIVESVKRARQSIKDGEFNLDCIFIICFVSVLICLLLVEGVGVSKANGIYIPMIYFIAVGLYSILKEYKKVFVGMITVYIVMFLIFQYYYFFVYGKENQNASFNETTIEVVQYIEANEKFDGKKINISTTAIQPYIYTLIANETSPYEFNKDVVMNGAVYQYGRYVFYNSNIDENTVYVIVKTNLKYELRDKLLEQGFKREEYKNLEILYKDIEQ